MSDFRSITFSKEVTERAAFCFPLIRNPLAGIDYLATVRQLAGCREAKAIVVEETYASRYDGLFLLLRIRLSSFLDPLFATLPIFVQLETPVAELVAYRPALSILCTQGVHINVLPAEEAPLTPSGLLEVLESLPVAAPGRTTSHDLANQWGPHRLLRGIDALEKGGQVGGPKNDPPSALLQDGYYWYLLSLAHLRSMVHEGKNGDMKGQDGPADPVRARALTPAWENWRRFLLDRKGQPLRVLAIDDELDKGWGEAVDRIFGVAGARIYLEKICFGATGHQARLNAALATDPPWDLVLCDIRLTAADRSLGVHEDLARVEKLEGFRLMQKFKRKCPSTAVVAFTASNKAWMLKKLTSEAGIDGYWIKENPERGVSEDYSAENAAELIGTIHEALRHRAEIRFLWDLIESIAQKTKQIERAWNPPDRDKFRLGLVAILSLLKQAYGYVDMRPSVFRRDVYGENARECAFLHMWGCLNKLSVLAVDSEKDQFKVRGFGDPRVYARIEQGSKEKYLVLEPWALDFLRKIYPQPREERMRLDRRKIGGMQEHEIASLVLHVKSAEERAQVLPRLAGTRNSLHITHGPKLENGRADVTLNDCENLAGVLRYCLVPSSVAASSG